MHDYLVAAVGLITFAAVILSVVCAGILVWMFFCTSCNEPVSPDRTARLAIPRHPDPDSVTEPRYWAYVTELAQRVGTDGCTWALNIFVSCCDEHDLHYIYRHNLLTKEPISKAWADKRLRDCMRRRSRLGYYSPSANLRYVFVKYFGNRGKEWKADV